LSLVICAWSLVVRHSKVAVACRHGGRRLTNDEGQRTLGSILLLAIAAGVPSRNLVEFSKSGIVKSATRSSFPSSGLPLVPKLPLGNARSRSSRFACPEAGASRRPVPKPELGNQGKCPMPDSRFHDSLPVARPVTPKAFHSIAGGSLCVPPVADGPTRRRTPKGFYNRRGPRL
jgi:hypothetical protein